MRDLISASMATYGQTFHDTNRNTKRLYRTDHRCKYRRFVWIKGAFDPKAKNADRATFPDSRSRAGS